MKTKTPMVSPANAHLDFVTRKSDDIQKALNLSENANKKAEDSDKKFAKIEEGIDGIKTMITDQTKHFINVGQYTQDRLNDSKLADAHSKMIDLKLQQMQDKIDANEEAIDDHEKDNEPIRKVVTQWLGVAIFLVIAIPIGISLLFHLLK